MLAPIPVNECERMSALHDLQILDTPGERCYDSIVELAALICGTPSAAITLVDEKRQWLKASLNMEGTRPSREKSFCGHAVLDPAGLVVEDALCDVRFHDNPMVVGAPFVRFYAGKPLMSSDGYAVGALCVVDTQPRRLSAAQLDALSALAEQASALLELRTKTRLQVEEIAKSTRLEGRLKKALRGARIAQRAAEVARLAADSANRAKSDFLARMSHELRTPLNAIIGFSNVLRRNGPANLDVKQLNYASRITANGQHLLQIVNDVLDLSRIEVGKVISTSTEVSLEALMRDTVENLEHRVLTTTGTAPRVELVVDCPVCDTVISTDVFRMKQILLNLTANALKFTADGRVTLRCVVDDAGIPLRIDVVDTGIGIAADRMEAIFNPFEQADDETAGRFGGSGLGLSISRSLAELLGYSISVASEVGTGTTFSLHLQVPAVPAVVAATHPAAPSPTIAVLARRPELVPDECRIRMRSIISIAAVR